MTSSGYFKRALRLFLASSGLFLERPEVIWHPSGYFYRLFLRRPEDILAHPRLYPARPGYFWRAPAHISGHHGVVGPQPMPAPNGVAVLASRHFGQGVTSAAAAVSGAELTVGPAESGRGRVHQCEGIQAVGERGVGDLAQQPPGGVQQRRFASGKCLATPTCAEVHHSWLRPYGVRREASAEGGGGQGQGHRHPPPPPRPIPQAYLPLLNKSA